MHLFARSCATALLLATAPLAGAHHGGPHGEDALFATLGLALMMIGILLATITIRHDDGSGHPQASDEDKAAGCVVASSLETAGSL